MKNKVNVIILDFNNAEVHVYLTTKKKNYKSFIIKQGHSISNCEYMVVSTKDYSYNYHNKER